jgi:hypothetical protein
MDTLEILSKLSKDDDFFPTAPSIIRDSREAFWFHFGLNIFAVNPYSISTQLRRSVYPNRYYSAKVSSSLKLGPTLHQAGALTT